MTTIPRVSQFQTSVEAAGMKLRRKHILIIGGGFAGVAAARALKRADAEVTLIDRRNHHIFQPLLYQVATAVLAGSMSASALSMQRLQVVTFAGWASITS
jgi:NADH:ubiquinone reductase (H+-translocating)